MTDSENLSDEERLARHYFAQGDFDNAEILFGRLALASPQDAVAQYNWGVALGKLGHSDDAFACYRKALELNPQFADAYINLGTCLNDMNKVALARQAFALARQIEPHNHVAIVDEGISALALGDYENGWLDFSARWQLPAYAKFKREFSKPIWGGENLQGKILFLYAEQGFGDTFQMARFVPVLAAQGATVIVEVQPATFRLMQSLPCDAHIIAKGDAIPDFDYHCPMMDLPRALGTRLDSIPSDTPYLYADAGEIEKFRSPSGKKKIGLSWAGRASHENDHNRSLKFPQLAPLLRLTDIEWVSLQRIVPDGDAAELAASKVVDLNPHLIDFAATAAAIMNLDIVITVDTAIAHLAGALGKTVWVLLPFFADWRWLMDRDDSPWYPTARLFRQQKRRGWDEVISQTAAALQNLR